MYDFTSFWVSRFEDTDLHKKYNYRAYLLAYINIKHPGGGFNLDGKIKATNFVQKKGEEHTKPNLVASPVMKLPTAEHFGLTEDKEKRLSEINSRTGKNYDNDVVVKAMLQIRDILMKSDKLKTSTKNNTQKDFEFSYFDDIDDALIEGLSQNQDFFSLLLSNDEMKHKILKGFLGDYYIAASVYENFRGEFDDIVKNYDISRERIYIINDSTNGKFIWN